MCFKFIMDEYHKEFLLLFYNPTEMVREVAMQIFNKYIFITIFLISKRLLQKIDKHSFNLIKEVIKVLTERLDAYNFEGCEHLVKEMRKDLA